MAKEKGRGLLYLTISQQIIDDIHQSKWTPGDQLPGVRDLAALFDTSLKTVNRVLEELDSQGYIERIQGRGIFIRAQDEWLVEKSSAPYICFTPAGSNPVDQSLINALADEISLSGGELLIHSYRSVAEELIPERLPEPCRGVIAVSYSPDAELFPFLETLGKRLPVLYLGGFPGEFKGSYLSWDIEKGITDAVGYLVNLGHERIGYIGGGVPLNVDPGFITLRREFQRLGMELDRRYCAVPEKPDSVSGRIAMDEILTTGVEGSGFVPSAIISLYDGVAAGAMGASRTAGYEIPGDIAFLSCENSEVARTVSPALTALSLERGSAAALAGKLMELLESGRAGKRSPLGLKIPLVLEERGSTLADDGGFTDRWL